MVKVMLSDVKVICPFAGTAGWLHTEEEKRRFLVTYTVEPQLLEITQVNIPVPSKSQIILLLYSM